MFETERIKQIKKLRNRIIDSVRKSNVSLLIKLAKFLNIPVQKNLLNNNDNDNME